MESAELQDKIMSIIAQVGEIDRGRVTPGATLEALGLKSMDVVMIVVGIEEAFEIYIPADDALTQIKDVRGLVADVERRLNEKKAR